MWLIIKGMGKIYHSGNYLRFLFWFCFFNEHFKNIDEICVVFYVCEFFLFVCLTYYWMCVIKNKILFITLLQKQLQSGKCNLFFLYISLLTFISYISETVLIHAVCSLFYIMPLMILNNTLQGRCRSGWYILRYT